MTKPFDLAEYVRAHEKVVADSANALADVVTESGNVIITALKAGRKLISFGNGGSATQASHLAGELVGRFRANRQPLPAIALSSDGATMTCIGNDFGYESLFDRQIEALASPDDVAVGLTTSGKSQNVIRGLDLARARRATTIALTGSAGLAGGTADYVLCVPSSETAHIQEVHLIILHAWCVMIDAAFKS